MLSTKFWIGLTTATALSSQLALAADNIILRAELLGEAFQVEQLSNELRSPWGLDLISDHQLLISEKSGHLVWLDIEQQQLLRQAVPFEINSSGQGGLLDIKIAPADSGSSDRSTSSDESSRSDGSWVYLTYSKAQGRQAATALGRFQWLNHQASDWQELWVSDSWQNSGQHFGSRIAFDQQGHVFFSVGDRGDRDQSQNVSNAIGGILRLTLDGQVPQDNPFVDSGYPALWSYGHRNPQGLFFDHTTNSLWSNEHGPRGGDEINLIQPGANYGWPRVTTGREYWGPRIGTTSLPSMVDPLHDWTPSIAPSSLLIYRQPAFANWQSLFISTALAGQHLNLVDLRQRPAVEHRILTELNERLRAARLDSEGRILILTDSGRLLRVSPAP